MSEIRRSRPGPHQLHLDLPAAHSASRMARQIVREFARGEGLGDDEVGTLELVTSELLSNAVDHGGGEAAMEAEDRERDVRMHLELEVRAAGWRLVVTDEGGGTPEEVERFLDPDAEPELEDPRGRGIFLVRQAVDRLTVARSEDGRGLRFEAVRGNGPTR